MSTRAEAWFIDRARPGEQGPAQLRLGHVELPDLGERDILVAPILGCWEGNMGHAVARDPIDICEQRGEESAVLGNAAVVRVLRVGPACQAFREGQKALLFCNATSDRLGYPIKIFGYDAPGSVGVLSKRCVVQQDQLIALPERSRYSDAQWAAFSLRYVTAWANWELAFGVFRLLMTEAECPEPQVWGWGGGVTCAQLDLAQRAGCKVTMVCSRPDLVELHCGGRVPALNRARYGALQYEPQRWEGDREYRAQYRAAEEAFAADVHARTGGEMVQIFFDYIGEPMYRATLRVLGRSGVISTAGWKHGMKLTHLRARECIERHQHIHTHYARHAQGERAVAFAEANGWMPVLEPQVYRFQDVPQLAADYARGATGYFPMFAVNPE